MSNNEEIYEYDTEKQKIFLSFLISSEEIFTRCQSILDENYFDSELKPAVRFLINYTNNYNTLPMKNHLYAETKIDIDLIDSNSINEQHKEWFFESFENFCRHKAIENAIIQAPQQISKGQYDNVEKEIKNAVLVSLEKDLGINTLESPKNVIHKMKQEKASVSTGWKTIDYKLYGGMNPGEITIFAANSGVGKSLFLQNLCINWAMQGLDVVYFTLELSEALVSMRTYAMLSGFSTKEVWNDPENTELYIKYHTKNYGNIQIKYMTSPSTNELRSFLKEYEISRGKKPDGIAVDYLDIMRPNDKRINPSDMFIKDKYVTEELRGMANDLNLLCGTASQLNRSAINDQEIDQSHIAGGLSKINTTDNLMAIEQTGPMKDRGEYKVHFIKTRSSSGVGSKVTLAYDVSSLRITDNNDDDSRNQKSNQSSSQKTTDLTEKLRRRVSTNNETDNDSSDKGDDKGENNVQHQSLESLMNRAKSRSD